MTGWKLIFENLCAQVDFGMMAFAGPLAAAAILFLCVGLDRALYAYKKLRFTVEKNRKSPLRKLTEKLVKNSRVRAVLNDIAVKVGMYTDFSFDRNLEIAAVLVILSAAAALSTLLLVIPRTHIIWYMLLAYAGLAVLLAAFILHVLNTTARIRFTSKLPETYKLLNSRYISKDNILKAIYLSLYEYDDFDKAVKKVMRMINDVLNKNNMAEIDETFKIIENTYKNEYLTLLLNLIRQAHYNGGKAVIKEQFERTTEDILLEIENQKDLSATGRSYILLAALMPLGIAGIEGFNGMALQAEAAEFYNSIQGIEFKILFFTLLILYIGCMLFLERTA